MHHPTAVDIDRLAADKPGPIAGEKQRDARDVGWMAAALAGLVSSAWLTTTWVPGYVALDPFDPALGQVGRITTVRPDVLAALLAAGFTPVVAPMAPAATGEILNVNADDAAAALAAALQAPELLFISDVSGVLVDGAASQALSVDDVEPLIARGAADGGMAAKLRAAASARSAGVASVRLGSLDMLRDASAGTRLVAAPLTPTLVP